MINIQDIIPFMKNGWVAMDRDGSWWWYGKRPTKSLDLEQWVCDWEDNCYRLGYCFDIEKADDWKKSLRRVKND